MAIWNNFEEFFDDTLVVELKRGFTQDSGYALEAGLQIFRDQVNTIASKTTYDTLATVLDKRTTALAVTEKAGHGNVYKVFSDAYVAKYSLANWWELEVDKVAVAGISATVTSAIQAKVDDGTLGTGGSSEVASDMLVSEQTVASIEAGNIVVKKTVTNADTTSAVVSQVGASNIIVTGSELKALLQPAYPYTLNATTGVEESRQLVAGTLLQDTTTGKLKPVTLTLPSATMVLGGATPVITYDPSTRVITYTYAVADFPTDFGAFNAKLLLRNTTSTSAVYTYTGTVTSGATDVKLAFELDFVSSGSEFDIENIDSRASIHLSPKGTDAWWSTSVVVGGNNPHVLGTMLGDNSTTSNAMPYSLRYDKGNLVCYVGESSIVGSGQQIHVKFVDSANGVWESYTVPLRTNTPSDSAYNVPDMYEDTTGSLSFTYEGAFSNVTTKTRTDLTIDSLYRAYSGNAIFHYKPDLSKTPNSNSASTNWGIKVTLIAGTVPADIAVPVCAVNGVDISGSIVITKDTTNSNMWYIDFANTTLVVNGDTSLTFKVVDATDASLVLAEVGDGQNVLRINVVTDAAGNLLPMTQVND